MLPPSGIQRQFSPQLHQNCVRAKLARRNTTPSFALAHSMYGWVLVNAGRFETAEQETRTALRLSPKDCFASLYELVRGLTLLTNRQYEEAYAHLQRALVAFPEYPNTTPC